jgi:hypothetical protein
LAILGCLLVIYLGSYGYLSVQGHYGPEYVGGALVEGPAYNWEPKGFHNDYGGGWHRRTYFYFPLFILDRSLWHPTHGKTPPP